MTCSRTNTQPTAASGADRLAPCCTAPTRSPMAMANTAGNKPRRMSAAHQPQASPKSAFGRTLKNFHSLRWRRLPRSMARIDWFGSENGLCAYDVALLYTAQRESQNLPVPAVPVRELLTSRALVSILVQCRRIRAFQHSDHGPFAGFHN